MKSYALQIIRVWNDGISLDDQRHTPVLLSPRNARRNVLRQTGFARRRSHHGHAAVTQRQSRRNPRVQTIKCINLHYTQHSLTTTYHIVDTRSLSPKFALQPWYVAQTNVRLGRCFVNAASHECRPSWMTSQWSALTNQRPLFHTRYFCNTYEKFHGTFHTCMNSYVEDFKSFTEHFIRVWIHTSKISYAYQIKRVWKNTCIPYVKFREWYCIMIHV